LSWVVLSEVSKLRSQAYVRIENFLIKISNPPPLVVDPERFYRSGENCIGFSTRQALVLGIIEEKPMHE